MLLSKEEAAASNLPKNAWSDYGLKLHIRDLLLGNNFSGPMKQKLNCLAIIVLTIIVWKKKGEAFKPKNTIPTVKHRGGSIMLSKCFKAVGIGAIQKIDSITSKIMWIC